MNLMRAFRVDTSIEIGTGRVMCRLAAMTGFLLR